MANTVVFSRVQAFDLNGDPVPGAKAFFFETGTTEPATVYADVALETPHPSPLVASAEGVFPLTFTSLAAIKVTVTDAAENILSGYPMDPAPTVISGSSGASSVSFSPTTNIPVTNVQAAIVRADANIDTRAVTKVGTSAVTGTVDMSGGTLTLANNQINGASVTQASTTARGTIQKASPAEGTAGTATDVYPDVALVDDMIAQRTMRFTEVLYESETDGVVGSVFIDLIAGHEYTFRISELEHNSATTYPLKMQVTRSSDSVTTDGQIGDTVATGNGWDGVCNTLFFSQSGSGEKVVLNNLALGHSGAVGSSSYVANASSGGTTIFRMPTNNTVTRIRFFPGDALGDASFNQGRIWAYRTAVAG